MTEAPTWPPGKGEMAERIRRFDWAQTALGPIEDWSERLKAAVELMLAAPDAAYVGWGPELIAFYNDLYLPILGDKHPSALGQPSATIFPEIWEEMAPILAKTLKGEAHRFIDRPLRLGGRPNDAELGWFNVAWAPLRDQSGEVAGFIGTITDTTMGILADRRLHEGEERQTFLLALSDALRRLVSPADIAAEAAAAFGKWFGMNRVFYAEISGNRMMVERDYSDGVSSIAGEHALEAFGMEMLAAHGEVIVPVSDVEADERLSDEAKAGLRAREVGAYIDLVLFEDDRRVGLLSVQSASPRNWTPADMILTREVGERIKSAIDRVRADAVLRESEERFRLIVESARDYAIFTTDPDRRTLGWYAGAEAVFGYTADEIVGHDAAILFTPEDIALGEVEKELATAREQGSAPNIRWHVRKDRERVFIDGRTIALRGDSGDLRGYLKIGQDVTERRRFEQILARSEERLRLLVAGIPQLVWRAGAPAEWTWASEQWSEFTGQPEEASRGHGWLDMVHPHDRASALECWSRAAKEGGFAGDYRVYQAATDRYRWFQTRATPVRNAEGEIVEWLGTSTDVDELRTLQKRQQLLLAELQHRVRNILAMTRSVARRTLETANDVDDYASHLEGRLSAMARTQAVLTRSLGQGVDLEELVLDELEAQAAKADQYRCSGPEVALSPKAAEVLTLSIHELATNATKYGAFASPTGRVDVYWDVEEREDARWLRLCWSEHGLDLGNVPVRPGFGTELITRRVPYELRGEGEIEMRPQGVRAAIRFPLAESRSILQTDADVKEAAR